MVSYAVTGSSRGIGFGFIQALAADPSNIVFALVRSLSSAQKLKEFVNGHPHKNIHVFEADLDNITTIQTAAKEAGKITGGTLDVLINNAALMHHERNHLMLDEFPDDNTLDDDMLNFYKSNVLGTIHMINAFLPLLRAGVTKKCILLSSALGSAKLAQRTGALKFSGYAMSKAALNLAAMRYATRYKEEGVIFLSITPGLVKTLQGTPEEVDKFFDGEVARIRKRFPQFEGAITVEQSVRDQLELISRVTIEQSGDFVNRDGSDAEAYATRE